MRPLSVMGFRSQHSPNLPVLVFAAGKKKTNKKSEKHTCSGENFYDTILPVYNRSEYRASG